MSGQSLMKSREVLLHKLKQMRLSLRKFIYQDLLKHCEPEDARQMAVKREAKIYESTRGSYAAYDKVYQQYIADNPDHAPPPKVAAATMRTGSSAGGVPAAGYGGHVAGTGSSLADVLHGNNYTVGAGVAADPEKHKLTEHIKQYVRQLREGLRIAQEFPMEYPRLQEYRERITTFLHDTTKQAPNMNSQQLRQQLLKIKQIAESCMDKQTLEKMTKHHRALKMKHAQAQQHAMMARQQQVQAQQHAAGAAGVSSGLAPGSLTEARAALKQKVMKLLPIRTHIKTKLETAPNVPNNFKTAYGIIRKKIERIAKYYTDECNSMAHVAKCTQYLHATYQEWKKVIAAHQTWIKRPPGGGGASSADPAAAAAAHRSSVSRPDTVDTHNYIRRLRMLYDSYKKMLEFRNETKGKDPNGKDAIGDEDDQLFSDEVTEAKLLLKTVQHLMDQAKQRGLSSSQIRLPDGVKKRIAHLAYSLSLRQQFVLYRQLHTLEKCESWCRNAKGGEWYLQLQQPVKKLIGDIAQLKSMQVPSPATPRVFANFLEFRKQAALHQRAGGASPAAGASAGGARAGYVGATGAAAAGGRARTPRSMAAVAEQMGLGPPTGGAGAAAAKPDKKALAALKRQQAAAKRKETAAAKKRAEAQAARKKAAQEQALQRRREKAAATATNGTAAPAMTAAQAAAAANAAALKRKQAAAAAAAGAGTGPPDPKRARAAGAAGAAAGVAAGAAAGAAGATAGTAGAAGADTGAAAPPSVFDRVLQNLKAKAALKEKAAAAGAAGGAASGAN